jgi:hypothetical protein
VSKKNNQQRLQSQIKMGNFFFWHPQAKDFDSTPITAYIYIKISLGNKKPLLFKPTPGDVLKSTRCLQSTMAKQCATSKISLPY